MASRYTEPLMRILMTYPPGSPGLLVALETYIKTCLDRAHAEFNNELASTVCEGLHNGPAKGLKCLACYEAEVQVPMQMQVEAEREIGERAGKGRKMGEEG